MKWVLLAVFFGVGCGSDAVYGGIAGVHLDDLPGRIAQWNCQMLFQCCTPAQVMTAGSFLTANFKDEAGCRAAYEEFLSQSTPQIEHSISQGRMQYDEGAAGSCIAKLDRMTCAQVTSGSAPQCNVFIPLQKNGEACESESECISSDCEIGLDPQGTCAPPAKLGEPCSGTCEKGAFCDAGYVCSPQKKLGEPCGSSSECESAQCSAASSVCIVDSICPG